MQRLADIAIIAAGPGDAAGLARVHVTAWRETYSGILPASYLAAMDRIRHARRWTRQLTLAPDAEIVLAAEGREGLVGYCGGQIGPVEGDRRIGEVHTLYLLRSVQGGGLGRRLLHALAKVLRARGAGALRLWVLDGNDQACGFYRRLGGVAAGSRPVSGWGGAFAETAYVWRDIDSLTGG